MSAHYIDTTFVPVLVLVSVPADVLPVCMYEYEDAHS